MANRDHQKTKYYSDIDGLRAIAVIAVIINHLNSSWLPGGFLGVDIFFVISGFVVTASLLNNNESGFTAFIIDFYKKRIKRLYPALIFSLLISLFVTILFVPDPNVSLRTAMRALYGVSNFYLMKIGANYFAQDASLNMFTHTWSLAVEEQFYFLFPVLLFFTTKRVPRDKSLRNFLTAATGLWFVSFGFFLITSGLRPDWAFYLMPSRFWQLLLGAIIFTFPKKLPIKFVSSRWQYVLLTAIFICFITPEPYKVYTTTFISFLTALSLLIVKEADQNCPILNNKASVFAGKISYSLYLWHWPVIVCFRHTLGLSGYFAAIAATIMIFLSLTSYFLIETPLRPLRWTRTGVAAFITVMLSLPFLKNFLHQKKELLYLGNKFVRSYSILGSRDIWKHESCSYSKKKLFSEVFPAIDCSVNGTLSNHADSKKIYAFGNSYLNHIVPALSLLAEKHPETTFYAYSASGCPLWPGKYKKAECPEIYHDFLRTMENLAKKDDAILLSFSLNLYFFPDDFSDENGKGFETTDEVFDYFIRHLRTLTQKFRNKNVSVYFTGAIPILTILNPEVCYQPWSHLRQDCQDIVDHEIQNKLVPLHHRLLAEKDINYINLFDPMNDALTDDPKLIRYYYDQVHFSSISDSFVMPLLERGMKL